MSGPVGIPILAMALPLPAGAASSLRPGQTFQTTVQGQAPNLFLPLNGTRVPVGAGLSPGQQVTVTVAASESGLQIRVQPQAPAPAATKPSGDLTGMLANMLQAFGAPGMAQEAAGLLPPDMPPTPAALRSLLTLFTARGEAGRGLQWLAATLTRAAKAGALANGAAADFAWLVAQAVAHDDRDIPKTLRHAGRHGNRGLEAKLAAALRSGGLEELVETLRGDLRAQLSRLLDDPGLMKFLRNQGVQREFQETANEVLNRLSGRDLQNLHGAREPYVFFELPFGPESPIRHVQVHLWSHGGRRGIDPERAQAALDLSTTALGDLWIALSVTTGHCACTIRATDPEAVAFLEGAGGELVEALCVAGYTGASVRVGLWDGNRLREAAALVRQMAGVNVTA